MMRSRNHWIALASLCLLPGCQDRAERDREQVPAAGSLPSPPALSVTQPLLDREALLLAVAQAASDAATGRADQEVQRKLDGSRFELRLRFGCAPQPATGEVSSRGWAFDEKRRILSWRIEPEIANDASLVQALGGGDYEAVEGFWIHRPWLLRAACPVVPADAAEAEANAEAEIAAEAKTKTPAERNEVSPPSTIPSPRIGIAQFFTKTDPRTHRRDKRAYTTTKVLGEGEVPGNEGYDLVISGRLRRPEGGRVIACRSDNTTSPPSCIIWAEFDNVAIQSPGNGEIIAKWSSY